MRKILVAYDGSLLSRKAIEEAKRQAKKTAKSEVHIVSTVKDTGPTTNAPIARGFQTELMEKFEPQMERIREEFEKEGIPISTDILFGRPNENPGKKICMYAREHEIELIIAGSRGLGKVKNILLGSVSSNIVHHAECPVLIMK